MARLRHPGALVALLLVLLPLLFFHETILGGKVLLPVDNLFQWEPWRSYAAQLGVGRPQNSLLSDLILENYPWKKFLVDSLQAGQLPLWNPYLFAGAPFLASGQHSALYPLSVLFYLLPIANAFSYVTALNFFLCGLFTYLYLRALSAGHTGALIGAIAYTFSGFMVVSVVFPMVISAAVWLPLLLLAIEMVMQRAERGQSVNLLLLVLGAAAVGIQFLAGHVEISLYVLLTAGFFTACRLVAMIWQKGWRVAVSPALQALAMVAVGSALAAVQMVPYYEYVTQNFRQGSASYDQVISWAYTWRQIPAMLMPDSWGNPSHSSYFDLITMQQVPVTTNYLGEPIQNIMAAGVKNYVEAGAYLGLLPLLLAVVAAARVRNRYTWTFLALAVVSLLFTFGAPTYKIPFYLMPGWNQLHTPFRWVFPYTFSACVLAGLGAGWLSANGERLRAELAARSPWRWFWRAAAWGPLLAGVIGLGGLAASLVLRGPVVGLADRVLARSGALQRAFASGEMLYSYEFRNFLIFSAVLVASGVIFLLVGRERRLPNALAGVPIWQPLAVALVAAELFVWGSGFNPATDPALLNFTPPAVQFLQSDPERFRITGYGDDSMQPNAPMIAGIEDIRGYDSIILKQYTDFMGLIEKQGLLMYNRVGRLFDAASLDSPLLDLLNVKYVVTEQQIDRPNYRLVYDRELKIYLNEDYLPRTFIVHQAEVLGSQEAVAARLQESGLDLRRDVLLEQAPAGGALALPADGGTNAASSAVLRDYQPSGVLVDADLSVDGFLVLTDTYADGWKALVDGKETEILRADYNFRAVYLPAGNHEVEFRYRPQSFLVGGFVSLAAGAALVLAVIYSLWRRFYRMEEGRPVVQRVAKNSLTPMMASLANKGIDFAFAMIMLRVLGPEGVGKYAFAIVVATTLDILTNFGMNTLLAREVAKDRDSGNTYLSHTALLRLLLWAVSLPLLGGALIVWRQLQPLADDTVLAIGLLVLALVPGHLSTAMTSLFQAHERMEYPAGVTVVTKLVQVSLGLVALILGWGFVGLASAAVVTNVVTVLVLLYLTTRVLLRPRWEFAPRSALGMLRTSFPLMINNLLAVAFFRVDYLMLQPMRGDIVLGWYSTAYKFLDGLNIIPSTFTLAIFPLLSRYAASARDTLHRSYCLALKYLLIISFPIAVGTTLLATDIINFFAGPAYLPHSAIALQILIWFLPFSYVNSVTQYVLIALDEQRFITVSFLIAVPFNIVGNLIAIPLFGYGGAAVVTILSEVVLLVPFFARIRRHLPNVSVVRLTARPMVASAIMGVVVWAMGGINPLVVIPVAAAVYAVALLALGTFDAEDRFVLSQLLGHGGTPEASPLSTPAAN